MNRYLYYPGCSLKGSGRAYEESLLAVFDALDVQLEELDDWNCCGATAYMSVDEAEAFVLAGRNIALASRDGADLLAPCSACYLVLNKSMRYAAQYPQMGRKVRGALRDAGLAFEKPVDVRHPLDVLVHDIGLEAVREKATAPLKGIKVAPYYGCQIVRPYATFDDQLVPVTMDRLLEAAGAEVVPYPLKTRCCGGSQCTTIPEVGSHLVYLLLEEAHRCGADVVATVCPLCQFNLDAYQDQAARRHEFEPMPVVYFTQLVGLALGVPAQRLGLSRNVVPFEPDSVRRAAHVA